MGNGSLHSTTVRVKNNKGDTLEWVSVSHRFRKSGDDESYTWRNVKPGTTTNDDLKVSYRTGLGSMSDYDWWKVIPQCNGITYHIDPYSSLEGYKSCYLKEEDKYSPVTIIIKSSYYDGINFLFFFTPFFFFWTPIFFFVK